MECCGGTFGCWITGTTPVLSTSHSTIEGGRGCHKFVLVLGGDSKKIATPGELLDQPPCKMS